ncbi:MAG: tail fiber domain-containing protein [Paludibacter sp.]|jgi:hypothetical protein|nr:tail fiber domain-containing protein [Paludibacter sp.]
MKKAFSFVAFVLISIISTAQTSDKMSFQAMVRNSAHQLVTNSLVGMRISILKNEAAVFVETHVTTTNANGLLSVEIGAGSFISGVTLSEINWAEGPYFIKTETDPLGGANYTISGTSQLLNVPYALYAKKSGSNLQNVLNSGNSAETTVTNENRSAVMLNTNGGNTAGTSYNGFLSSIQGTNGSNSGIRGMSTGINAYRNFGVYGVATNASGLNTGVNGIAYGPNDNYAVWGVAYDALNGNDNRGIMGYAVDPTVSGRNIAVTGWAGRSDVVNIAVVAYVDQGSTVGANNFGVEAVTTATSTTGTNYGVYAKAANAATNFAGFFDGNVMITGTLFQPSDRKFKTNILPITNALDKIEALQPVAYNYNSSETTNMQFPSNSQFGFIAQDIEQVFPDLVVNQSFASHHRSGSPGSKQTTDPKVEKEEFKGINYTGLISILAQGIKEQQQQIQSLKTKIADYEERIITLEKLIQQ